MNKVLLTGVVDYGKNGAQMDTSKSNLLRFTLRVKKPKNQIKEGSNEIYEFIDCVAFGKTSEMMTSYVKQLSPVTIEGSLNVYNQNVKIVKQDGSQADTSIRRMSVLVNQIHFLPAQSNNQGTTESKPTQTQQQTQTKTYNIEITDEDLPF
ncbi:MAG: single-stranded DNA-binding protein [Ignavibacterium sp.]|nr:single-stranded DNA-binding protein [Ignavibacterium sp.]